MSTQGWSEAGHGLVLVRGTAAASARWLRRGLVAVAVEELPGWTGVCLSEEKARSAPPYDVGLEVLAARPVPGRRRPSIGLFVIDGCAVVTVQPRGWRADQRWLVWEPGAGVRRTTDLPALPSAMLVQAASAGQRCTPHDVSDHLAALDGEPADVLAGLMRLLGLPGEQLLLTGPSPGSRTVEPSPRGVGGFDALMAEERGEDDAEPAGGGTP